MKAGTILGEVGGSPREERMTTMTTDREHIAGVGRVDSDEFGEVLQRIPWDFEAERNPIELVAREWLVTNGLGGHASGTGIVEPMICRFHGLLIAALSGPLGRVVMLSHLSELVRLPDAKSIQLGGEELAGGLLQLPGAGYLAEFVLEEGLPVWRYRLEGCTLEKRLLLPHMQNTAHVTYRLLNGNGPVR